MRLQWKGTEDEEAVQSHETARQSNSWQASIKTQMTFSHGSNEVLFMNEQIVFNNCQYRLVQTFKVDRGSANLNL